MGEKFDKFKVGLKASLRNLGNITEKTLSDLEKSDRELNEKLKKAMGSASDF